jgi:O-antigen/teichoic acid export membrane protein
MKRSDHGNPQSPGRVQEDSDLLRKLTGKLTRDTLRYIPAAIIPAVLSVVSVSVFTRVFIPQEYGLYALVIAATTILGATLSGWMQQSVLRYLPRFRADGRLPEFLSKLIVLMLGTSLAVGLLFFLIGPLVADRWAAYGPFLIPAALLIVSEMFFLILGSAIQADLRSKTFSIFKISKATLQLGFSLAFVFLVRRDVVGLIAGAVVANVLLVGPMLSRFGGVKNLIGLHRSFDSRFLRMFAAYGFPMIGWLLCGQILEVSDRFILGAIRGEAEVGVYSANYNLVRMGFGLISGPILTAMYAVVMNAWEDGYRGSISNIISQFSRYYLIAVVPLVTYVGVFRQEIVSIVLGSEFREGYTIVPLVLGGAAFWGLGMIAHKGLEIHEKTNTMLMLVIISTVTNLILNFVLIPDYGYDGAAFATFISYLLYPIVAFLAARRYVVWHIPWLSAGRIAVAAVVMAGSMLAVVRFLPDSVPEIVMLVVAALVGLPAYAGILFAARELRADSR